MHFQSKYLTRFFLEIRQGIGVLIGPTIVDATESYDPTTIIMKDHHQHTPSYVVRQRALTWWITKAYFV